MVRILRLILLSSVIMLLTACNGGEQPKSKNWAGFVERYGCTRGKTTNLGIAGDGKRIEWECGGLIFGQNGTNSEPSTSQLLKFEKMMAEHGVQPKAGNEPRNEGSGTQIEEPTEVNAIEVPAHGSGQEAERDDGQWSLLCYIFPYCS